MLNSKATLLAPTQQLNLKVPQVGSLVVLLAMLCKILVPIPTRIEGEC